MAVTLTVIAVGLAVVVPGAARITDRWAVHAAREELAALLARARAAAPAAGGAWVDLDVPGGRAVLADPDTTLATAELRQGHRVEIDLGGRARVRLVFDALGIGRIASRTIVLARGRARDTLTVSSYGRVTR